MFSNPADKDAPGTIEAREIEVREMKRWVKEGNARNGNAAYKQEL